jgi:hypothetical protein
VLKKGEEVGICDGVEAVQRGRAGEEYEELEKEEVGAGGRLAFSFRRDEVLQTHTMKPVSTLVFCLDGLLAFLKSTVLA